MRPILPSRASRRSHGRARRVAGDDLQALRVQPVPFEQRRHPLLAHEDGFAHGPDVLLVPGQPAVQT